MARYLDIVRRVEGQLPTIDEPAPQPELADMVMRSVLSPHQQFEKIAAVKPPVQRELFRAALMTISSLVSTVNRRSIQWQCCAECCGSRVPASTRGSNGRRLPRTLQDQTLGLEVAAIFAESRGRYGSPRVHAELRVRGQRSGRQARGAG
jgi:HTH-like domain